MVRLTRASLPAFLILGCACALAACKKDAPESADDTTVEQPGDEPIVPELGQPGQPGSGSAGSGTIAPGMPVMNLSGTASDGITASTIGGPQCPGFVPAAPQHTLVVSEPVRARFEVTQGSNVDLMMAIVGPGGPFCDDDSADNRLPRIDAQLLPGSYSVHVGTYAAGATAAYSLQVNEADSSGTCTSMNAVTIGADFTSQTVSGNFTNTGDSCATATGYECQGQYNAAAAGPCITITAPVSARFTMLSADFDPVIALSGPAIATPTFNDDGEGLGLMSQLSANLTPGQYTLNIGSYGSGSGAWTMRAENLANSNNGTPALPINPTPPRNPTPPTNPVVPTNPAAGACIPMPAGQSITLSGGAANAIHSCNATLGIDCLGYLPATANHCVRLNAGQRINARITDAAFDPVLAMRGPTTLANDDCTGDDLLSCINGITGPGDFHFYIGGYDSGVAGSYSLVLSPQ